LAELLNLELTAMAHGGLALGRHAGRVVFVPHAIPGETVRVEIVEAHDRWARARLLEVLEPSPQRVEPPCTYFGPGKCGGCHLQHIDYPAQAELKRQVLADQLARVGGLRAVQVRDMIAAAEPWRYRNQVTLTPIPPLSGSTSVLSDEIRAESEVGEERRGGRFGLPSAESHGVFPVEECLIVDPLIDETWSALDMEWPQLRRLSLRCGSATGDRMAVFELDHYEDFDIEVDLAVSCVLLLPDGETAVLVGDRMLTEEVAGRRYRISAGSLFPANTAGAEALVAVVRELLEPQPHQTLVDLYCGVGLFSLGLADSLGRVTGIEIAPGAAADFRHNALGMDHVHLVEQTAEQALPNIQGRIDLMVLDPPRAGAGGQVLGEIGRVAPRRIAYVSSDPATLARDARWLTGSGYRMMEVQPVDLLPQTFHVDCVALFVR
jgi:23S rRNA (uracil1939-C5)-methyltransferase